jgi:phosphatidylinositol 4-kinase
LAKAFPLLICSNELLSLGLELVQLLWQSCDSALIDQYRPRYQYASKSHKVTLELPDNYHYRRDLSTRLTAMVQTWVHAAQQMAPLDVAVALQIYLDTSRKDVHESTHKGRSLALALAHAREDSDQLPEFIYRYALFQRFHGQVQFVLSQPDAFKTSALGQVKKELADLLAMAKSNKAIPSSLLNDHLTRATCFLIELKHVDYELLHLVCWTPATVFTPEAVQMATLLWTRVLLVRPDLETRIMMEVVLAWSQTIQQQRGLFSSKFNLGDPLRDRMKYEPSSNVAFSVTKHAAQRELTAHLVWIEFLRGRFEAVRYKSHDVVNVFVRAIQIACSQKTLLCRHPMARAPLFQLLLLGLAILKDNSLDSLIEFKFRSLLYNKAFNWFSSPFQPFAYTNTKRAEQELGLLKEFYQAVEMDKESIDAGINKDRRASTISVRKATSTLLKDTDASIPGTYPTINLDW